jgi:hypothetical protein
MSLRALALVCLALVLPATMRAQVPHRPRPDVPRVTTPADSAAAARRRLPGGTGAQRGDTTQQDTTVQWSEPDSVMRALLDRTGYAATRYEGDVVTFDARTKALSIENTGEGHAQVEREGQRVITDSTIVYNDVTRDVVVDGHFKIALGSNQPPVAGFGTARYNLAQKSGRLTNAQVAVQESGAVWFIRSNIGKTALGDSARGIPTRFYGVGGSLTSCDDSIPDYHFALKEIKRTNNTLVARPAVLYVQDIPVMWLPFVFQDIRPGRRSGVLPPRFGASDIVRNNPSYHRHVENLGYYWALNDYMGATTWLDWRSGAGIDTTDPGWTKFNGEFAYNWMSRFLSGRLASSYMKSGNGQDNLAVSWDHSERFGQNRSISSSINYVTSPQLQRQNTFNPYQAMATIHSSLTYSDKIGPASLQLGGTRTQYPGRQQVDQAFPSVSITTGSLALAKWLVWTPNLSFHESATLHIDQPTLLSSRVVPGTDGQLLDTTQLNRSSYTRSVTFDTPIRIFGYDLRNGVTISDLTNNYPDEKLVYPHADSSLRESRVFLGTYKTTIDWNPTFSLPSMTNRFKVTPSVSLQNVDPNPFWIRTEMTGGKFVHQSKRLVYGLSASPAIYGLIPGFGPFSRFRHAIMPVISYNIAPAARVNDDYLAALGAFKQGYLGSLPQSSVSLQLSQNIEAKVNSAADTGTTDQQGQKLKVLSMQFTALSYDFERAKATHRKLAGLTTSDFGTTVRSDLLPGFDFAANYSMFEGSTISDTAKFKPFLTRVTSSFRFSQHDNPFAVITRLFGRAVPESGPSPQTSPGDQEDAGMERAIASQPVAGQASRAAQFVVPPTQGWSAQFSFSTSRPRPLSGDRVLNYDPRSRCDLFKDVNPFAYQQCYNQTPATGDSLRTTTQGGIAYQYPRQTSLNSSINFALTQKWSAAWQTNYDFEAGQFAAQIVTLQRDLHDWRAMFAFTKSPNGNFAFNFYIALKPQPDLKFDYSRASVRGY